MRERKLDKWEEERREFAKKKKKRNEKIIPMIYNGSFIKKFYVLIWNLDTKWHDVCFLLVMHFEKRGGGWEGKVVCMQGVAELGGGKFFFPHCICLFFFFFFSIHFFFFFQEWIWWCLFLCSLPSDPSGQLNVLGHNCYPLSVDGTQIGVLKETHQISFACFLKSKKSLGLIKIKWRCVFVGYLCNWLI